MCPQITAIVRTLSRVALRTETRAHASGEINARVFARTGRFLNRLCVGDSNQELTYSEKTPFSNLD